MRFGSGVRGSRRLSGYQEGGPKVEMHRKEGASLALAEVPGRRLHDRPIKAFWSARARREVPELEESLTKLQPPEELPSNP